ncbi:PE-PPE domain-containing protein [Mycobacterium sp. SMC-4]|uniref:PE-PPE domain-containing protein n=1 Tax=Mycobacterium sp. SMC-4 TaxID=2857059 RepID=UPI0021B4592E|nr:PE-PPE domain-containing protein [Mycobacterium sp. SMC-4]UXA18877.1 PE-PPE domain-containing protein [Mycobacterium sp. SMC-4]
MQTRGRSQARALILVVLSFITVLALGIASAFVSAVALGATALIVPGTGTPNSDNVANYQQNAWNRYIDGIACTDPVDCANPTLEGIPYPASFWPMTFIPGWCVPGRCDKWNESVGIGVANLNAALEPFLAPSSDEDVFIFGYSQGGAVVANTLQYLAGLDLSDEVKARLQVVTIGGIENPDGGLWQRLAWLRYLFGTPIPIFDVTFNPPMPVDTGIHTTSIGFEYDPVGFAPRYWGNVLAVLNAFVALDTVHGYYLSPNGNDPNATLPYGYTPETLAPQLDCSLNEKNCRTDTFGNSYIIIPALSLPLTDLVRSFADHIGIGWLAKPFIDLVEPVLREAVDLGYDWSGDPGVPRSLSILPFKLFQNWIKVGIDFAVAAVKGVEAFLGNFIRPRATSELEQLERSVQQSQELGPAAESRRDTAPGVEVPRLEVEYYTDQRPGLDPQSDAVDKTAEVIEFPTVDVVEEPIEVPVEEDTTTGASTPGTSGSFDEDAPAVSERGGGSDRESSSDTRTKRTRAAA